MGDGCVAVCFIVVVSNLPQYVWSWLSYPTMLAIVVAASALAICWRLNDAFSNKFSVTEYAFSLTSDGIIRFVNNSGTLSTNMSNRSLLVDALAYGTAMKIHHSSQLFTWGLCINVLRQKRKWFERDNSHLAWILKGECCEADYRRLSRAIILARKAMH